MGPSDNWGSSSVLYEKYLKLLGVESEDPYWEGLRNLVAAQLARVPFENISKLYYLKRFGLKGIPSLEQYVEGIERYHFGGTCYSNNYYFGELLKYLGYDVRLCGADMSTPDCHMVNIVTIEGREYVVDVGYGAPFVEPMPRDMKEDYIISFGRDRYVLKPQDGEGRSKVELWREGVCKHGYVVNPVTRSIDHFAGVIESSYRSQATFMNALLVARYSADKGTVIHNQSVVHIDGAQVTTRRLKDRDEIPGEVETEFGIPRAIVWEALAQIGPFTDAWG